MKKFFALFFMICLLITTVPCGASYLFDENPYYSIELPDDYELAGEDKFISGNGDAFSVSYEANVDKFCVEDLSEKEMKEYAEKIATEGEQALKLLEMDGKMEIVSYKKIENINGKTALEIVLKTSVKRESGETMRLQKIYQFSGKENKYTFTYTAKEDKDINSLDEFLNTIVINEHQIESRKDKFETFGLFAVVVALIFIGVIKFVIRIPYKKK